MIPQAIYLLCAATALACAMLLLRAWVRTRARLLLWAAVCFAALTANNVLLVTDRIIVPENDLSVWRAAVALVGVSVLLFGLVWEDRSA